MEKINVIKNDGRNLPFHIATIEQVDEKTIFEYSKKTTKDFLSVSIPPNGEYTDEKFINFFENLLPEGKRREFYAQINKFSPNDTFELLAKYGEDTAGVFSFIEKELPFEKTCPLQNITEDITKRIMNGDPLDAIPHQRMSLAGMENKTTVVLQKEKNGTQLFLPDMLHPSTHIIKSSQETSVNEAFCMFLAAQVMEGMEGKINPVAHSELKAFGGTEAYMTKRYDRIVLFEETSQQKIFRLSQEDFCQAMGRSPDDKYCLKYQGKGINNKDIYELLEKTIARPYLNKEKEFFIKSLFFSMCIGNFDDHAKNYALMHTDGSCFIAPLYDLVSILGAKRLTAKWASIDTSLARPFGKEVDPLRIKRRDFDLFAEEFKTDPLEVIHFFQKIGEKIVSTISETTEKFKDTYTKEDGFSSSALQRIDNTSSALKEIILKRTTQMLEITERAEMIKIEKKTIKM